MSGINCDALSVRARTAYRRLLCELALDRCWFCDARASGFQNLCQGCERDLPWIRTGCVTCGEPMASGRVCGACTKRPPPWSRASVALRYELPVDHLIQRFKYHQDAAAGRLCGALLSASLPQGERGWVMPVPMHRSRLLQRGSNHARRLASDLVRARRLPGLVIARRVRETAPQHALDARERRRNLRGAFAVEPPPDGADSVILVDDIVTTGETLRALASACHRAGYQNITIVCVARGGGR